MLRSIDTALANGKFVSINYLNSPGFTDTPAEAALCELVATCGPDFIQLRNLNMDPELYLRVIEHSPAGPPLGIRTWLERLRQEHPTLRFGYFNPPLHP